ncbi:MAG: hypothetical protein ACLTQI_00200 [Slackia sp.]
MMRMLDEGVAERDRVGRRCRRSDRRSRRPEDVERSCSSVASLSLGCALVVWAVAAALFFVTYHPGESRIPDSLQSGVYEFELLEDARRAISDAARWLASIMQGNLTTCAFLRRLRAVHGTREGDGAGVVLRFLGGVRYALCTAGLCVCAAG